ncbi:hypothetical protein ACW73O_11710 [Faecalibacterium prausnitzii]
MPTVDEINTWIQANILDSQVWDKSEKKEVAIVQAERNLKRWFPEVELTTEIISYQVVWELQGLDPAVKYQKQGVKMLEDGGERIDYGDRTRDVVSPEVREILGTPLFEQEETVILEGGMLL